MAHKTAKGSTALGRDSESKRLGVKLYDGEIAKPGSIILRQRGRKYRAGANVAIGKDDTLFALRSGIVHFTRRTIRHFDGSLKKTTFVHVVDKRTDMN